MTKQISSIDYVNECIDTSELFELRFNKEYPNLTESITSISFGKEMTKLYVTVVNFGEQIKPNDSYKVYDYNLDLNDFNKLKSFINDQELNLVLYDRTGKVQYNFEFVGISLEDIAEQRLNYNTDDKFKTYILIISYMYIYDNIKEKIYY